MRVPITKIGQIISGDRRHPHISGDRVICQDGLVAAVGTAPVADVEAAQVVVDNAGSVFSDREFRNTLGLFATGVVVVTCTARNGEHFGATVSSFSSVSLDPPLILFSIGRSTHAFAVWEAADHFAVNVLSENQSTVSTRFARALTDKWEGVDPDADANGSPVLPGTLARLSCSSYARYDGGDHLIVVGRVDALTPPRLADPRPLVFFAGQYRRLDSGHPIQTPPDTSEWLHGW